MSANTDSFFDIKRKMLAKYPRFGSEIAAANIEFRNDLPFHTAATDGKNIYFDPNYFENLSENDKLFTIAHEILHIKFMHMFRLIDKDGKMRNLEIWNIATDAIINANLERDGFTIKEGLVNMSEAIQYSAEEFYQKLLEENEQKEQQSEQNQGQGKDNNKGDYHGLWEKAFEEQQQNNEQESQGNNSQKKGKNQENKLNKDQENNTQKTEENEQYKKEQADINFNEKEEFENNRKEKREKFKSKREKIQKEIRSSSTETIKLGEIGKSKEEIDWRTLIRREIEQTETIWTQRRSIAENNYAYRLEENDIDEDAKTEIMIDISGSVKLDLVKAFLRQIKPLLKQSKLKVGCFNERFWGFVDIKNIRDIDNFSIPQEARGQFAWTEDWDLAVRSFSKKREINKIVFTDGYPCPGTMPKKDLIKENVIWLVYGNKDFDPCCGKVIHITERQLERLHLVESLREDVDR